MSGFTGTVEDFTNAERNVYTAKQSMDQNLLRLQDNIEATRAGWQGGAAEAFNKVMERFNTAGGKLGAALENIGNLLQQAGSKYEQSEQQQQDTIAKLNSGFEALG
ncbi:WXG100 family type VII secretion target [Amycolatopsis suaedae]|uniref:ESAT-6-like protein n=1 Tax=Amycolatopsis suaedae TaxID=2510978 RepID=A0A4Q7JAL1_9PSEU|nr:WXG100 family type VII secretion target [Amycolatopsis suaedae]RZQ64088.1 WXG100 family type VII secretion target [Amycolatopsis suaedae]